LSRKLSGRRGSEVYRGPHKHNTNHNTTVQRSLHHAYNMFTAECLPNTAADEAF